jgi:hypothetical protein
MVSENCEVMTEILKIWSLKFSCCRLQQETGFVPIACCNSCVFHVDKKDLIVCIRFSFYSKTPVCWNVSELLVSYNSVVCSVHSQIQDNPMFRAVFWVILPCRMIVDRSLIPDDGGSTHLLNVGRQSFYTEV